MTKYNNANNKTCKYIAFVMSVVSMAQPVPEQIDFPKEEEKILQLWTELNAFHTSLQQSKNRPRSETWSS